MSDYRFTSDQEPSEQELAHLMHEVALVARQKAEEAQARLDMLISLQIKEALSQVGRTRR